MNTSLICLAVLFSAEPNVRSSVTVYRPSKVFEAAVRGQTPTYEELPPLDNQGQFVAPQGIAPGGTYVDPFTTQECIDCQPVQQGHGFYGGFEAVFVKPHFSSDAGINFNDDRDNGGAADQVEILQFDWDLEFSPRFWVGYTAPSGVGAQVRYWYFDQDENLAVADVNQNSGSSYGVDFKAGTGLAGGGVDLGFATSNGDSIQAVHNLELHALDIEGTYRRGTYWGSMTFTGGVRYGKVDQMYRAQLFDATNTLEESISAQNTFEGWGPTVSLFGRRRLGNSNFAVFANGRLSALYGTQSGRIKDFNPNSADPDNNEVWRTTSDSLVPISELQVGVDWSTPLWGVTRLFLRAALEGQVWWDAGTGMYSVDGNSNLSPLDGNLGLYGFTVGGGLTY